MKKLNRQYQIHQKRIQQFLKTKQNQTFKILDTCRLDNRYLIKLNQPAETDSLDFSGIVSFVPAAGAASRYFKPFSDLKIACEEKNLLKIYHTVQDMKKSGAIHWAISKNLSEILNISSEKKITPSLIKKCLEELSFPKALLPFSQHEHSFYIRKRQEQSELGNFAGDMYVIPPHMKKYFLDQEKKWTTKKNKTTSPKFLTQDGPLSTIRFNTQAQPVSEKKGQFSFVPAGHGSLIQLMPHVKKSFPKAHSIFIRNIDNVMPFTAEAISSARIFLQHYLKIYDEVKAIRRLLSNPKKKLEQNLIDKFVHMQEHLFHTKTSNIQDLKKYFDRPLSLMGQVPNSGKDVGGTPVIADTPLGKLKLCLEVPHASSEDKKNYLENPAKATHFNPVFVLFEIPKKVGKHFTDEHPFWLIAEKNYRGENVYYHESLLYEVVGNSLFCNLIFCEIPRVLFNPHKSL